MKVKLRHTERETDDEKRSGRIMCARLRHRVRDTLGVRERQQNRGKEKVVQMIFRHHNKMCGLRFRVSF